MKTYLFEVTFKRKITTSAENLKDAKIQVKNALPSHEKIISMNLIEEVQEAPQNSFFGNLDEIITCQSCGRKLRRGESFLYENKSICIKCIRKKMKN